MTDGPKRRLGDIAFIVRDDYTIGRAVVSRLGGSGPYGLSEYGVIGKHYFDYAEAVAATVAQLQKREAEFQQLLQALREQIAKVQSPEYEQEVQSSQVKVSNHVVSIGAPAVWTAPKEYWEPGQEVYAVITPATHNTFVPHHRPHPYYLLQTRVKEAILSFDGTVAYRIESHFSVPRQNLFADIEDAKTRLVVVVEGETGGIVPRQKVVVETLEKDVAENKKIFEDICAQVKKEFERVPND